MEDKNKWENEHSTGVDINESKQQYINNDLQKKPFNMLPLTLSLNIEKNSMIKRCKDLTVRPKRECLAYRLH